MFKGIYCHLAETMKNIVALLEEGHEAITNCVDEEIKKKIASIYQEKVIQFANKLKDEYRLNNSKIVVLLEKYCQDLYGYTAEKENGDYYAQELARDIELIMPYLEDSVDVNNNILSLTVIVKNEAEYIIEWLEYHRMVGVKHFYIYDNDSTDNLFEKLSLYIKSNIVTYIKWPGQVQQLAAYYDALNRYKYETKYMGFIDADEFLVPVSNEYLPAIIEDIFGENEKAGGIGVNWRNYGSSFHEI